MMGGYSGIPCSGGGDQNKDKVKQPNIKSCRRAAGALCTNVCSDQGATLSQAALTLWRWVARQVAQGDFGRARNGCKGCVPGHVFCPLPPEPLRSTSGTCRQLPMASLRWVLGLLACGFTRGSSLQVARSVRGEGQGPCDQEHFQASSGGRAAPVASFQCWKMWFWHWGAWVQQRWLLDSLGLAKQVLSALGDGSIQRPPGAEVWQPWQPSESLAAALGLRFGRVWGLAEGGEQTSWQLHSRLLGAS